jgi:hypothetical protein
LFAAKKWQAMPRKEMQPQSQQSAAILLESIMSIFPLIPPAVVSCIGAIVGIILSNVCEIDIYISIFITGHAAVVALFFVMLKIESGPYTWKIFRLWAGVYLLTALCACLLVSSFVFVEHLKMVKAR